MSDGRKNWYERKVLPGRKIREWCVSIRTVSADCDPALVVHGVGALSDEALRALSNAVTEEQSYRKETAEQG